MSRPRVKICGLTRRVDAEAAVEAGAAYLGVVLAPGGKRSISPARAADILRDLDAVRVGVFVDCPYAELTEAAEHARLDVVQLHGDETPEDIDRIRAIGPWKIWKAVRPRSSKEFEDAVRVYSGVCGGLLLDGWSPDARGGTGSSFPWAEVAQCRDDVPATLPLITAGGMRIDNVGLAVDLLRPDVVDVSSGVELQPGIKNHQQLRRFIAAVLHDPHDSSAHA